ncbi:MAG TPA: NfeD family protein [Chroococcidiopsis sp.]
MQLVASQPAHVLWLVGGVGGLALGMLVGEPTLSALGIAAFITAIASLTVKDAAIQLVLWGVLSVALVVVFRGFLPKKTSDLSPGVEARVSKLIPRGDMGEVTYEGSYWSARCQITDIEIREGQFVQVIGRQGNTLIVLPTTFADDSDNDIQDRPV